MVANGSSAPLPPRWFVRLFWKAHRGWFRATGGRRGLWLPTDDKWGALRLTSVGRRSGQERAVILGYIEDGPDLVTMAMNGWGPAEPAWWLNLQAQPGALVETKGGGVRNVVAHAASGEERSRLWKRWQHYDRRLDDYARRRPGETAVVVLAPAPSADRHGRAGAERRSAS